MRVYRRSVCYSLVILGLCLGVYPALAQHAAYDFTDTLGNAKSGQNETIGSEFSVNTDIFVTALGVFDSQQDGLVDSHDVGIWDTSGTLLASTTVASGTSATLSGKFRYSSISSLLLQAGQHYVIGAFYAEDSDGSHDSLVVPASGFSTDPNISYITTRIGDTTTLGFPTGTASFLDPGAFGPGFQFSLAAIPEPAFFQMAALLGLGGLGLIRKRRAGAAK